MGHHYETLYVAAWFMFDLIRLFSCKLAVDTVDTSAYLTIFQRSTVRSDEGPYRYSTVFKVDPRGPNSPLH